ncbi:MAG: MFS transporter [Alphaproteobacteria bacterium]|nr:MFS transporter [Alphaproteobacteria bacterium]MBV9861789.1 MFS transporter [Alphaproteobacteria bacterium]
MRKIYLRLLPFGCLCMIICYLDRINVGFAALTMRGDLGLSATAFGFGAGCFYAGYCLFEVPSNVILMKVGARFWIARIMISWGVLSMAMAFVWSTTSFIGLRFLLGLAEAGFFPGMLLYFTFWFPAAHRARMVAWFGVATPAAVAIGGPISSYLMLLDGTWGIAGWKWLFIGEGLPAVIAGCVCLFYLVDGPMRASWLTAEEKDWLAAEMERERREVTAAGEYTMWQALTNLRVLALAAIYFGIVTASVGLVLFAPQIIKQSGLSNFATGFVTSIPYLAGVAGMILWGHLSDRMHERRWNLFFGCLLSVVALVAAGSTVGTYWAVVGMCLATVGFYGSKGPFWSLPNTFLSGTSAAAGLAFINSVGNLGGWFGPTIVGWVSDVTGGFKGGLYALAAFMMLAAVVTVIGVPAPRRRPLAPALESAAE